MGECTGHVRRKKIKLSVLGSITQERRVNLICGTERRGKNLYIYIYIYRDTVEG